MPLSISPRSTTPQLEAPRALQALVRALAVTAMLAMGWAGSGCTRGGGGGGDVDASSASGGAGADAGSGAAGPAGPAGDVGAGGAGAGSGSDTSAGTGAGGAAGSSAGSGASGDPADEAMGGGPTSPCVQDTGDAVCEAVTLINLERAAHTPPLPPLRFDARLAAAAATHNDIMIANGCFAHVCAGEAGVGARIDAAGYAYASYGETIGAGYGSAQAMVDAWMNSPGHRAILLGSFADVGLAVEECPTGCTYGIYWSADFATPR